MLSVPPLLVLFCPFTPVPRDGYPLSAFPLLFSLPNAFLSHLEFLRAEYSFCFQTLVGPRVALDFALGSLRWVPHPSILKVRFFPIRAGTASLLILSRCHSPTSSDSVYTFPAKPSHSGKV